MLQFGGYDQQFSSKIINSFKSITIRQILNILIMKIEQIMQNYDQQSQSIKRILFLATECFNTKQFYTRIHLNQSCSPFHESDSLGCFITSRLISFQIYKDYQSIEKTFPTNWFKVMTGALEIPSYQFVAMTTVLANDEDITIANHRFPSAVGVVKLFSSLVRGKEQSSNPFKFIPLGTRYNANILNVLIDLINKRTNPEKKHTIIATVSKDHFFKKLGLQKCFEYVFVLEKLNTEETATALSQLGFDETSSMKLARHVESSTVSEIVSVAKIQKTKNADSWIKCWNETKKKVY